jgi:hypothetical protein
MENDKKNYIDLKEEESEAPIGETYSFCGDWYDEPHPIGSLIVMHKTIGGKGVVAKIEK